MFGSRSVLLYPLFYVVFLLIVFSAGLNIYCQRLRVGHSLGRHQIPREFTRVPVPALTRDSFHPQKDILAGVLPDPDNGNILRAPWDSLLGKIIRKNKLAFRLYSIPDDSMILTDISSVGSVLAGIVNRNLNPDLTSEGVLLRVMASSVYPPRGQSRNAGDP